MTQAAPQISEDLNIDALRSWIGRETTARDHISSLHVTKLQDIVGAALEERPAPGQPAPLGVHWCLSPPDVPRTGLQSDGHPQARFTILPPVPLARRMWAGGELQWFDTLRVGDEVARRSTLTGVTFKHGRNGPLCFVEVAHEYTTARGTAIRERQDIVYRGEMRAVTASGDGAQAPEGRILTRASTNTVQLFRYSALTGNSHRIHYDYPYATDVEGYPALVVHGPLQATMLMQAASNAVQRTPVRFRYKATSPMFCGEELIVSCDLATPPNAAWTSNADGRIGMRGEFEWGIA